MREGRPAAVKSSLSDTGRGGSCGGKNFRGKDKKKASFKKKLYICILECKDIHPWKDME